MNDQSTNPFWDYSIALYRVEGVAPLCLELQDRYGVDVNVLLYAGWLAHLGLPLTQGHLAELEGAVAQWREQVVQPLRQLRRQWRDVAQIGVLRQGVKDLELQAERQQQDIMYASYCAAAAAPVVGVSLSSNLAVLAAASCVADGATAALLDQFALLCERANSG